MFPTISTPSGKEKLSSAPADNLLFPRNRNSRVLPAENDDSWDAHGAKVDPTVIYKDNDDLTSPPPSPGTASDEAYAYKLQYDKLQVDATANTLRALLLSKTLARRALSLSDETAANLAHLNRIHNLDQTALHEEATTIALALSDTNKLRALLLSECMAAEALQVRIALHP